MRNSIHLNKTQNTRVSLGKENFSFLLFIRRLYVMQIIRNFSLLVFSCKNCIPSAASHRHRFVLASRIPDHRDNRRNHSTEQTGRVNIMSVIDSPYLERVRNVVPQLEDLRHKGQAGRIGIVGGSTEYTGAPYLAAISALRLGADLVHVFCPTVAAPVIKSYSPELIVHPLLDLPNAIVQMEPWLERLHVLVIGPGLGRDRQIQQTVSELIRYCRQLQKPLVIDADGLFFLHQDITLIKDYSGVILTPNAMEFSRLFGSIRENLPEEIKKLGKGVTIIEKGLNDRIYQSHTEDRYECPKGGSGRRCGGQGDLLCGTLATFYHWALDARDSNPALLACFAASVMIKECNAFAFEDKGRSMIASDMIEYFHKAFEKLFEPQKKLSPEKKYSSMPQSSKTSK